MQVDMNGGGWLGQRNALPLIGRVYRGADAESSTASGDYLLNMTHTISIYNRRCLSRTPKTGMTFTVRVLPAPLRTIHTIAGASVQAKLTMICPTEKVT